MVVRVIVSHKHVGSRLVANTGPIAPGNKRIQYLQTVDEGSIQNCYKLLLTICNKIVSKRSLTNITYGISKKTKRFWTSQIMVDSMYHG